MTTEFTSTMSKNESVSASRMKRKRKRKRRFLYVVAFLFVLFLGFMIWFFFTGSGKQIRYMMADSIITTRHRYLAKYLIGQKQLDQRVQEINKQFNQWSEVPVLQQATVVPVKKEIKKTPLVRIEHVHGAGFQGYIVYISDPKKLRVVVPSRVGKGEKVSSMVKRTGAILGVNGGGFIDPHWKGNGFQPEGVVMSGGKIFYNDSGMHTPINVVGIDKEGHLIAGKYTVSQLVKMHVNEAVTFAPRFIVNGKGLVKNEADGWGIAPRTCIAQKKDGTIMIAVIDGRQPGYSLGATLYDIQKLFLERGAIIAANLDGGSSTVLVHDNKIIDRPSSKYGERYIPTAWLVFQNPDKADIKNIWKGLDISKIDPSKW